MADSKNKPRIPACGGTSGAWIETKLSQAHAGHRPGPDITLSFASRAVSDNTTKIAVTGAIAVNRRLFSAMVLSRTGAIK